MWGRGCVRFQNGNQNGLVGSVMIRLKVNKSKFAMLDYFSYILFILQQGLIVVHVLTTTLVPRLR